MTARFFWRGLWLASFPLAFLAACLIGGLDYLGSGLSWAFVRWHRWLTPRAGW